RTSPSAQGRAEWFASAAQIDRKAEQASNAAGKVEYALALGRLRSGTMSPAEQREEIFVLHTQHLGLSRPYSQMGTTPLELRTLMEAAMRPLVAELKAGKLDAQAQFRGLDEVLLAATETVYADERKHDAGRLAVDARGEAI